MILTHIFDRWYLACMECTHAKIRKNHQGTQVGFIILSFSHSWIIDKISTTAASYVAFHGAQQEMCFTLLRPTRLFVCGIHLFRDPLHRSRDVVVVQYYLGVHILVVQCKVAWKKITAFPAFSGGCIWVKPSHCISIHAYKLYLKFCAITSHKYSKCRACNVRCPCMQVSKNVRSAEVR